MTYLIVEVNLDMMSEAFVAATEVDTWIGGTFILENLEGRKTGSLGTNPMKAYSEQRMHDWLKRQLLRVKAADERIRSCHLTFKEDDEELAVEYALRFGTSVARSESAHL